MYLKQNVDFFHLIYKDHQRRVYTVLLNFIYIHVIREEKHRMYD